MSLPPADVQPQACAGASVVRQLPTVSASAPPPSAITEPRPRVSSRAASLAHVTFRSASTHSIATVACDHAARTDCGSSKAASATVRRAVPCTVTILQCLQAARKAASYYPSAPHTNGTPLRRLEGSAISRWEDHDDIWGHIFDPLIGYVIMARRF